MKEATEQSVVAEMMSDSDNETSEKPGEVHLILVFF